MRTGGKILAEVLEMVEAAAKPGVTTLELDQLAEQYIVEHNATPSFKGYGKDTGNPFPATLCTSVNEELVHGIPSAEKILKSGDLLKVDVGVYFQGLHTDAARTMGVGKISAAAQKIMSVTEESFWEGIKCLKEGAKLSSYSKQVQKYIEKNGLAVVRNLVGHGVGKEIHEDPYVPNFYNRKYEDLVLKSGMTLALEPMVNAGGFETVLGHDGWIFKSKDGSLTAHYENTVVITKEGVEVLTI